MYPGLEVLALVYLGRERAEARNRKLAEEFDRPSRFGQLLRQVSAFLF